MEALVILAILGVALAALRMAAQGAITVCVAEVVDGTLTITRGGVAPRVLADLRDVVKRPPIPRATVRILRAKERARIEVVGTVSDAQLQQLRNVIGNVPLQRLIATGTKR